MSRGTKNDQIRRGHMLATLALFLLASPLMAQPYKFDVKTYGGAICDGSDANIAHDTVAIQKTIDDVAAVIQTTLGSPGPIYFPASAGPCKVDTLTFPDAHYGWLVSVFENALSANKINIGSRNAFFGRGGALIMGGFFAFGPTSSWIQWQHPTNKGPFVELSGASQVYFEGINIQAQYSKFPTVDIHDKKGRGSTNIAFMRSAIGGGTPAIQADASGPSVVSGFTLHLENCSVETIDKSGYAMDITNYGMIKVRGGYLGSMHYKHHGVPSGGDVVIEDVLSESLQHSFFLNEAIGPITDITLRDVKVADNAKGVYLFKHLTKTYVVKNVKIEMIPNGMHGDGLIDPTRTPEHIALIAEGYGAQGPIPYETLYWGELKSPQGPTTYYGSKHVPVPMVVKR